MAGHHFVFRLFFVSRFYAAHRGQVYRLRNLEHFDGSVVT